MAQATSLRQGDQHLIAPEALPEGIFGVIRMLGNRRLLCLAHLGHGDAPDEIALEGLAPGLENGRSVDLPGMPAPTRQGTTLHLMPGTATWLAQP